MKEMLTLRKMLTLKDANTERGVNIEREANVERLTLRRYARRLGCMLFEAAKSKGFRITLIKHKES